MTILWKLPPWGDLAVCRVSARKGLSREAGLYLPPYDAI